MSRDTQRVSARLAMILASPPMENMLASFARDTEPASVENANVNILKMDNTQDDTVMNAQHVLESVRSGRLVSSVKLLTLENFLNKLMSLALINVLNAHSPQYWLKRPKTWLKMMNGSAHFLMMTIVDSHLFMASEVQENSKFGSRRLNNVLLLLMLTTKPLVCLGKGQLTFLLIS